MYIVVQFVLGLIFIFLCSKLIITHNHTPKQREIKIKRRIRLNHNMVIMSQSVVC